MYGKISKIIGETLPNLPMIVPRPSRVAADFFALGRIARLERAFWNLPETAGFLKIPKHEPKRALKKKVPSPQSVLWFSTVLDVECDIVLSLYCWDIALTSF